MLDKWQDAIAEFISNRTIDLDIDLDDEEELAKQQAVMEGSEQLVLDEKAAEVFEVMERYGLPKENVIETLMKVLDTSRDSAKALVYKHKRGYV